MSSIMVLDPEPEDEIKSLCGICGKPHKCSACNTIKIKQFIQDKPVLSKARLSLPNNLKIVVMSEGSHSILALETIQEGTRFGPFEAKKIFTLDPNVHFPLKVFQCDYFKEYYLDTSDEFECNWMYFIQPANNTEEQNLVCYEDQSKIYYVSMRKIVMGEHLKVWYSQYYGKMMNINGLINTDVEILEHEESLDINKLVKEQQCIRDRKIWMCKFCGKQQDDVIAFAIHISEHYNMQLRKICEICKETFQTRKSLKKHMFLIHSNESYANNISLEKSVTDQKEENLKQKVDTMLGGPLLNEMLSETLENTNVLLDHMMLSNFDMDQPNIMLEGDNLNLGMENLLNDSENFNFNIEETNEKFVCDICLKHFNKLKLLITHLTGHTGKFTCKNCATVFSRKENLVSHRCNSAPIKCDYCEQKFSLKKYLTRHIATKHKTEFVCDKHCKKVFSSKKTLDEHKCIPEKVILACSICQKVFHTNKNLKRHLQVHYSKAIKEKNVVPHLCEICSKQYSSKKLLNQHFRTHRERQFHCNMCDKKFIRKLTFIEHMQIHRETSNFKCEICDQKFAVKKYLTTHMAIHNNEFKYECTKCSQKFKQKTNMHTHYNRMHHKKCLTCDEVFDTTEKLKQHSIIHYEKCYECPVCKHIVKLKSSLLRHFKKKHSQEQIDMTKIRRIEKQIYKEDTDVDNNNSNEKENDCDDIVGLLNLKEKGDSDTLQDIDSNLDYIVNNYDTNLMDNNFSDKNEKNLDSVLDFNSLEMEFEKNIQSTDVEVNQQVCLSMPELGDMDQSISLGENTFMLQNGNILEPLEQGKLVLYILDKDQNKC